MKRFILLLFLLCNLNAKSNKDLDKYIIDLVNTDIQKAKEFLLDKTTDPYCCYLLGSILILKKNLRKADIYIETRFIDIFEDCSLIIKKLAMSDKIEIMENMDSSLTENCVQVVTDSARIFLPLDNLIDKKQELDILLKEQEFCKKEIEMFEKKLSNENFLSRAPKHIVEKEQKKLDNIKQKLEKTNKSIEDLK